MTSIPLTIVTGENNASDRQRSSSLLSPLSPAVRETDLEDLCMEDAIVVLMGPTGSGKSTFVEVATGVEGQVGHGLASCTTKISIFKLELPQLSISNVYLVDTPGFDDTNKSDLEIFTMIADWLSNTYKRRIQPTGVLYFHRINDNRMAGTPLKNLRLFEKLCGNDFNKIVFTTTMWDDVDEPTGAMREQELQDVYWRPLLKQGSTVKRFHGTPHSAISALYPIIDNIYKRKTLLLQREIADLGLKLNQTTAGRTLFQQLQSLVTLQQEKLNRIREELEESPVDSNVLPELMKEYREVAMQMRRATADVKALKVSKWTHIFGTLLRRR